MTPAEIEELAQLSSRPYREVAREPYSRDRLEALREKGRTLGEIAAHALARRIGELHAATEQPAPAATTGLPIWDLVVLDMKARDLLGRARYGTPLQAHNGRDGLADAYQEALDLVIYLRVCLTERNTKPREGEIWADADGELWTFDLERADIESGRALFFFRGLERTAVASAHDPNAQGWHRLTPYRSARQVEAEARAWAIPPSQLATTMPAGSAAPPSSAPTPAVSSRALAEVLGDMNLRPVPAAPTTSAPRVLVDEILNVENTRKLRVAWARAPHTEPPPDFVPRYWTDWAAGVDLCALLDGVRVRCERPSSFKDVELDIRGTRGIVIAPNERALIPTGWIFEIPAGFEGVVRPRSGASLRGLNVIMGTVDADYRGEVLVHVENISDGDIFIRHGDRVAQFVISPVLRAEIEVVRSAGVLGATRRGTNGYGSSGGF